MPQMTRIAVDPTNPRSVWAGIEVDGLRHSSDGGDTCAKVNGGIPNLDIHNVAVSAGPPKTVTVVVNNDVYTSTNDGANWKSVGVRDNFPCGYPRGTVIPPESPNVVFITIGDSTPGRTGAIMRSSDTGQTWESLQISDEPNSAMWTVDLQPFNTSLALAGSRYGHLFRSDDGGNTWTKLWREFSEISSLRWVPG